MKQHSKQHRLITTGIETLLQYEWQWTRNSLVRMRLVGELWGEWRKPFKQTKGAIEFREVSMFDCLARHNKPHNVLRVETWQGWL